MEAKHNNMMHYDRQGDLHITIPRALLKKFESSVIFQVVHDLQKAGTSKRGKSWEGDSIQRIIGMGNSGISDGAERHDAYLYGDRS